MALLCRNACKHCISTKKYALNIFYTIRKKNYLSTFPGHKCSKNALLTVQRRGAGTQKTCGKVLRTYVPRP